MARRTTAMATLMLCALSAISSEAALAETTYEFNLPEQPLAEALRAIGRQTAMNILFDAGVVEVVTSPAVTGRLSAEEAIRRTLSGTRLVIREMGANSVVVAEPARAPSVDVNHNDAGDLMLARAEGAEPVQQNDRESGSGEDANGSSSLQEIVVTAQKREQRLVDVPISISVVSASDIDRRGLVSAADYLRGIPGVSQLDNQRGQSIVIRGIETETNIQNFLSGSTTATYFGETPTTDSAGISGNTSIDLKVVDVERIEVLRGPQGTAFGSSALGGLVRTIPTAPKLDRFEGKVGVGYGNTADTGGDNTSFQGVVNIPLVADRFAVRAVAYRYEDSGFYRNIAGSIPEFQSALAAYGGQAYAVSSDEVGGSLATGGRLAALWKVSDAFKVTLSYLRQKNEVDGIGTANFVSSYDQTSMQMPSQYRVRGQALGANDSDISIANAVLEYDLGWGDLLGTYSYIDSWASLQGVNTPLPLLSDLLKSPHRGNVAEVRLNTRLDGAFNFLGGLYFENTNDIWNVDFPWFGTAETNLFAPGEVGSTGEWHERRELTQKAAFGEVAWEFLPGFTLTGGARAYKYDRSGYINQIGPIFAGGSVADVDTKASGTSFRGNLSYKPNDGTLLYASWSQGFRLGKPQRPILSSLCDLNNDGVIDGSGVTLASTGKLDSDEVESYEIGSKFTLLDRRLTVVADVYRTDWSGMPFLVAQLCPGSPFAQAYLANAGGARSEGFEFQTSFQVNKAFLVDVGGSWTHARISTDVPAQGIFEGYRLPAPEFNANLGLQYEFNLGGHAAFVRADPIYVGTFQSAIMSDAVARTRVDSGGYVKLDVSGRVAIGNANVSLFMRNLTNEDAITYDLGSGTGLLPYFLSRLRPRTVELQLEYRW